MKTILLLPFLLFSYTLSAQNTVIKNLNNATQEYDKAQFKAAEKYYKQAYQLLQYQKPEDSLRMHTELQLGKLYLVLSDFDNAQLWFDKALKSGQLLYGPNHIKTSGVFAYLAKVQNRLNNTQKSQAYLAEMLKVYLLLYVKNYELSEDLESKASVIDTFIRLADETNLLTKIPKISLGIGDALVNYLLQLGRLEDSERLILNLQVVYKSRGLARLIAITHSDIGQISDKRYQYQQAQGQQLKAFRFFEKSTAIEDRLFLAKIWKRIGRNHTGLNRSDSAIVYKNKALSEYESLFTLPNQSIAAMYNTMAYDHLVLGNSRKSLEFLDRALNSGITDKLTLLYTKGLYLEQQALWEEAAITYKSALLHSQERYHPNKPNVLTRLAILLNYDLNLSDSAQVTIDQAIAINIGKDEIPNFETFRDFESSPDLVNLLNTLIMKANLLANEPHGAADISLILQSIEVLDLAERLIAYLRLQFILEEDNISFSDIISGGMEAFVTNYAMAYDQTKDQKYLLKAFEYSDMNKSQSLLEALKSSTLSPGNDNSLLNQWGDLKREIKYQEVTLANLKLKIPSPTDEVVKIQKDLEKSRTQLGQLLKKITKENTNLVYYISENFRKSKADKLQQYLKENNSIAIQYYISPSGMYQYLITGDSINYRAYNFGDTIKVAVNQVVAYIGKNSVNDLKANQQFLDNANLIYNKLFKVLEHDEYRDKDLIIIPEGYLSKLPFEVLLTDSIRAKNGEIDFKTLPYLIKERTISYAFSASVFIENVSRALPDSRYQSSTAWAPYSEESNLDEVQSEVFRSNKLNKLTGASKEIMPLVDKFQGKAFMDKAATESNFKEYAQKSGILHIATHGIVDLQKPEMSYLAFANEEDDANDGYLHLFEVYNLPIDNDLTILSACQSGDGRSLNGEGVISMARAFTYAGSRSVLMSLWLANDNSTSKVIQNFYGNLDSQTTKSKALRNSKIAYLESANNLSAHPYYWAHLVLSGDSSPITPSGGKNRMIMIILASAIILVIISRIMRRKHSA